jgi:hypothetical protein
MAPVSPPSPSPFADLLLHENKTVSLLNVLYHKNNGLQVIKQMNVTGSIIDTVAISVRRNSGAVLFCKVNDCNKLVGNFA